MPETTPAEPTTTATAEITRTRGLVVKSPRWRTPWATMLRSWPPTRADESLFTGYSRQSLPIHLRSIYRDTIYVRKPRGRNELPACGRDIGRIGAGHMTRRRWVRHNDLRPGGWRVAET